MLFIEGGTGGSEDGNFPGIEKSDSAGEAGVSAVGESPRKEATTLRGHLKLVSLLEYSVSGKGA